MPRPKGIIIETQREYTLGRKGEIQRRPSLWEHHGECDDEAQFYDTHGGDGTDRRPGDSAQDPLGHCYSTFDRLQESA